MTKTYNFFIIISILIVIALLLVVVVNMFRKDYHLCSGNPLVYGLKKMETDNKDTKAFCSCTINKQGKALNFYVNSENIQVEDQYPISSYKTDSTNYTKLVKNLKFIDPIKD